MDGMTIEFSPVEIGVQRSEWVAPDGTTQVRFTAVMRHNGDVALAPQRRTLREAGIDLVDLLTLPGETLSTS